MVDLAAAGISMTDVTNELVTAGVKQFADAYDKLLAAIESK